MNVMDIFQFVTTCCKLPQPGTQSCFVSQAYFYERYRYWQI